MAPDHGEEIDQDIAAALQTTQTFLNNSIYNPASVDDSRVVSPWLVFTGWHDEMKDHDARPLKETVLSAKNDFPRLQAATRGWLDSLKDCLVVLDKTVAQQLNTDDPTKT